MNEQNKVEEVATEAMENLGYEVTDVTEMAPVVESSGGWKTVGVAGAAVVGAALVVPKVAQKICDHHYEKQGQTAPTREKFYQFWRRKAKVKGTQVQEGVIHEVLPDEESEEED